MQLDDILRTAHEHDASDIHLVSGHPPMMRVNTVMTPIDAPVLTPESVEAMFQGMTTEYQAKRLLHGYGAPVASGERRSAWRSV